MLLPPILFLCLMFIEQPHILIQIPEMVSKIFKRTPPKSIKRQKRRCSSHQKRRSRSASAKKSASISVFSSINRSFLTCRRRLIKFFNKLSHIGTSNRRSHKGFKILKHEIEPIVVPRVLQYDEDDESRLPPLDPEKKGTIFLDLDETLIHSSPDPPQIKYDFEVRPKIEGIFMNFYVRKRPGVDKFLESISKHYEVVVFTAGIKQYASLVLDALDPKGLISHRLYRDSCKNVEGRYVKDLSGTGRDLRRAVIVDDNPNSYSLQPGNAIPIMPFVDDFKDMELEKLEGFLIGQGCDHFGDMREAVAWYLGGGAGGGVGSSTDMEVEFVS